MNTHSRNPFRFFQSLVIAFAGLGIAATAIAETTLEKIRRTGVMTSANNFEYAPFSYVADGKKVGLDVDLAEEIGRRMGVREVVFEKIDFRGLIAALTSGRVDTLVTAMNWTPERAERIAFSEPYFDGGIGAAYRTNQPVAKPEDLLGKRVGANLGSVGDRWAREKYGSKIDLKTYDSVILALKDLEIGRLDAVISPMPTMRYSIRTMPTLKLTEVWDSRPVGINTRLEDKDLMAEINKHMIAMKADGTMEKIVTKWFGAQ